MTVPKLVAFVSHVRDPRVGKIGTSRDQDTPVHSPVRLSVGIVMESGLEYEDGCIGGGDHLTDIVVDNKNL